jgi:dimethylglycine catabolism B
VTVSALPPLVVVGLAAVVAVGTLSTRAHAWRRGRVNAPVRISDLLNVPRRYLVDVHAIVDRRPLAARMHTFAAGGFLLTGILGLLAAAGLLNGHVAAVVIALSGMSGIAGAAFAFARRSPRKPSYLSGGLYYSLPWLLGLANIFFMGVGISSAADLMVAWNTPGGIILLLTGMVSLTGLALIAGKGPMRHALAGTLHLAWHPRPGRFNGQSADTAFAQIDLDAPKLGANRVEDFAWNELLGFDSCVQCGRCEAACPAFAAGLPLNPKRFVNDIAGSNAPVQYTGSPHPGLPEHRELAGPILIGEEGASIAPETIWACTTCRACVDACPMMIEHLDGMIALRRFETLEHGATPGKAGDLFDALRETDTQSGNLLPARLNFAADLALPLMKEQHPVEVLLWIGEGGYELRNQRSLRAFIKLMRIAQIDFAVLAEERDCGDAARRLGDEIEFLRLAQANIATLSRYSFRSIVTLDPHVAHSLTRDYPALGGNYQVFHHTTFLDGLVREGRLSVEGQLNGRVTYHDPCYLGRYLNEIDAPRALIDKLGVERVEMARHGRQSFCCGGGGGGPVTDIKGKQRIPDLRMEQARETEAEIVVVACPNCTTMLEGVTQPRPLVRELSEILLEAVERRSS